MGLFAREDLTVTWAWHLALLGSSAFALLVSYLAFRAGVEHRRTAARQDGETQDFLSRALRVPAFVVGVEEKKESLDLGYYVTYRVFCPVVEFRTWQGELVHTTLEVGVERKPPQIGEQIEICYDGTQPQRARLNGPAAYPPRLGSRTVGGCMLLVLAGVAAVVGILTLLLALFAP